MRSIRALTNARVFAARSLLALGLALATLSGVAPSGVGLAAGVCSMPCCRARKGAACPSCRHKRLKNSVGKTIARGTVAHDSVCGARLNLETRLRHELSTRNIAREDASADAGAVYSPCPSDCAGLLTAPTHSKRGRDEAIASQTIRPPPASVCTRAPRTRRADANTSELCMRCSPRAPPATRHAS